MLKNILYITLFVTGFIILWIGFSIKHNLDSSTITPQTSSNIIPITPTFDLTTLNELKSRTAVPVNLDSPAPTGISGSSSSAGTLQQITTPPKVTPSPEITPVASISATTQ